jgi:hypothetical protein
MTSGENASAVPFDGASDIRAEWTPPAVNRMKAGEAENGSGPTSDDPINYS